MEASVPLWWRVYWALPKWSKPWVQKVADWWGELHYLTGRGWWLTVYEVTREFGGPEEGGWWYNLFTPVESVFLWWPVRCDRVAWYEARVKARLLARHADREFGDIYSVKGGVELAFYTEWDRWHYATKERPHYE